MTGDHPNHCPFFDGFTCDRDAVTSAAIEGFGYKLDSDIMKDAYDNAIRERDEAIKERDNEKANARFWEHLYGVSSCHGTLKEMDVAEARHWARKMMAERDAWKKKCEQLSRREGYYCYTCGERINPLYDHYCKGART